MGKVAGKFVIILNINKVLSVEDSALLRGAVNATGETAGIAAQSITQVNTNEHLREALAR